jgi:hypothetical protein
MDFAKTSNYTIEIYFVLFYFGQRLYILIITITFCVVSSNMKLLKDDK